MRIPFKAVILLLAIACLLSVDASGSACKQRAESSSSLAGDSLVVDYYLANAVLKRSWAVIVDCRHPSWPAQAVEIPSAVAEGVRMPMHVTHTGAMLLPAPVI